MNFKLDFYSKFILTVIAILLFGLFVQNLGTETANAQSDIYVANPEKIVKAINSLRYQTYEVIVLNHDQIGLSTAFHISGMPK